MKTNNQDPDSKEFKIRARPDLDSDDKDSASESRQFETKEAYESWLEAELVELEAIFLEFSTLGSLRNYFGR